jgi:N-acetylmuramoyl-L-alanine amidase
MLRRFHSVAAITILPAMAAANSGVIKVTSIRAWSHPNSTRVIVETTGAFEYRSESLSGPERILFDIPRATPWIKRRRFASLSINDPLVRRVRVSAASAKTTRIVFELAGPVHYKVSRLDTPDRMVIDIRPRQPVPAPSSSVRARSTAPAAPPPVFAARPSRFDAVPLASASVPQEAAKVILAKPAVYDATLEPKPEKAGETPDGTRDSTRELAHEIVREASQPDLTRHAANPETPAVQDTTRDLTAHASVNGAKSLTRALGLKVNRIVIDAGHGGHDDGTIGPNGVLEKNVVLDVALRVAKLVRSRIGADVVLTRADDTFIPLRERTAIANQRKADLFLSIHANSSPSPSVAGTETFFLNFTNSPSALEVAARENAGSDKSVGELQSLIQSITLNDKITESQTFAQSVQNSLFAQAGKSNAAAHNRGVKRAPFVVLIGASMPSILAEIGFLSNARDEANLARPEYRQKIAESIFKGLSEYAQSLSHFEVARDLSKPEKPPGAGLNDDGLN